MWGKSGALKIVGEFTRPGHALSAGQGCPFLAGAPICVD